MDGREAVPGTAEAALEAIGRMREELAKAAEGDEFGDVVLDGQTGEGDPRSVASFAAGLARVARAVEELGARAVLGETVRAELAQQRDFCVESLCPEDVGDAEADMDVTYGQIMDADELLRTTCLAVKAYRSYVDADSARAEFIDKAARKTIGHAELEARIARAATCRAAVAGAKPPQPGRQAGADGKGAQMEKERERSMGEGCAEVAVLLGGEQGKLDAMAAKYGFAWDRDNMTEFDVGGPDGCKWEDGEAIDRALDVIAGICLACHALGFETGKGEDGKWRCAPNAG